VLDIIQRPLEARNQVALHRERPSKRTLRSSFSHHTPFGAGHCWRSSSRPASPMLALREIAAHSIGCLMRAPENLGTREPVLGFDMHTETIYYRI
jgi:hypothetical protein